MSVSQASAKSTYKVSVFDHVDGVRTLERQADGLEALGRQLSAEGLSVLSVEPLQKAKATYKKSKFPLLVFCQQLLSLLEAGLQLVEAIHTLTDKEQDEGHRHILEQLQLSLQAGESFSLALSQHPNTFPSLLQAAIEASEQTGGITDALHRFVVYETQFQTLKARLVGALIYPVILVLMGGLVSGFLLGYVVPRFSVVFADRLDKMPYMSALVIKLGLSISENPTVVAAIVLALLGIISFGIFNARGRALVLQTLTRLPWLGERIHVFELVRIYRALGMLLRGGIPAVQSMQMVLSVASLHVRGNVERAIEHIKEGRPMSFALKEEGLTTVVSERLLSVGERSGQMGDMMNRAADFLDKELEQLIDRAVRLIEPLMMVLIGGLIGGLVILMYLPIFELADSVQ
jgi:general secretion pathway protein F